MVNPNNESAAQFLLAARKRGAPGQRIPSEFRPTNNEDGLAIQARITLLLGQPVGGYKCSLPSASRPVLLAPIFAPTIMSFRFIVGAPDRYEAAGAGWALDPAFSGGGSTINVATHFIDLFRLLTGKEVARISAIMRLTSISP